MRQGTEDDVGLVDGDADHLSTSDNEPGGFLGRQIENAKTFVTTAIQSLLSQNVRICYVPFVNFVYLWF